MRKIYSIRLTVPEHLGHQIHTIALKESRSESATLNLLVTEALAARRTAAAETEELLRVGHSVKLNDALTRLIRGEPSEPPSA
jgi:hypothetical protein